MEWIVELDDEEAARLVDSCKTGQIIEGELSDNPRRMLIEYFVGNLGGVKIEVFSNEHPPPHFRAKYQGSTANFSIDDCTLLNGSGKVLNFERNIRRWHRKEGGKEALIKAWNSRRPDDCPVGDFKP